MSRAERVHAGGHTMHRGGAGAPGKGKGKQGRSEDTGKHLRSGRSF